MTEVQQLQFLIEKMKKEMEELKKENEELQKIKKEFQEKERKTKELMIIKEDMPEFVSSEIRKLLFKDLHREMIQVQEIFRVWIKHPEMCPEGLALTLLNFEGDAHDTSICRCHLGFSYLRATLDLMKWQDQNIDGYFMTAQKLFGMGFLHRLIIRNPATVNVLKNWRLSFIAKLHWRYEDGFAHYKILSVPASYSTGYPDEARHKIKVNFIFDANPLQYWPDPDTIQLNEKSSIEEQLHMARSFLKNNYENLAMEEAYELISEDRIMKIYSKERYNLPFMSHIDEDINLTHHYHYYHDLATIQGDYSIITTCIPCIPREISEWNEKVDRNIGQIDEYIGINVEESALTYIPEPEENIEWIENEEE